MTLNFSKSEKSVPRHPNAKSSTIRKMKCDIYIFLIFKHSDIYTHKAIHKKKRQS